MKKIILFSILMMHMQSAYSWWGINVDCTFDAYIEEDNIPYTAKDLMQLNSDKSHPVEKIRNGNIPLLTSRPFDLKIHNFTSTRDFSQNDNEWFQLQFFDNYRENHDYWKPFSSAVDGHDLSLHSAPTPQKSNDHFRIFENAVFPSKGVILIKDKNSPEKEKYNYKNRLYLYWNGPSRKKTNKIYKAILTTDPTSDDGDRVDFFGECKSKTRIEALE